jgi:hypothetical protein
VHHIDLRGNELPTKELNSLSKALQENLMIETVDLGKAENGQAWNSIRKEIEKNKIIKKLR